MAKAKVKMRAKAFPHLAAALVCEKVIVESDKVPSYMRVVDEVTLPRPVSPFPRGTVIALNMTFVISFRAGTFKGTMPLKIGRIGPAGERTTFIEHSMDFSGKTQHGGTTLGIQMYMMWDGEGLYRFDVFLGGIFRTSVPLLVSLAKASPTDSPRKNVGRKRQVEVA